MIKLPKKFKDIIIEAAKKARPEEICGLVGGIIENGCKVVKEIYILENIEHSNDHFTIDPKDQINAIKDMRSKGYVLLGNFHSHTQSQAIPSDEDKRLAYDENISYMIVSVMNDENPVLNSFHIEGGISTTEDLIIT